MLIAHNVHGPVGGAGDVTVELSDPEFQRFFSYSYVDSGTAGTKAEAAEASYSYFPSAQIKAEPVAALIEDRTEADDEAEDSVNWIGRRREGSACFVSSGAQKTTTFAGGKHPEGGIIVVRGGRRGEKREVAD